MGGSKTMTTGKGDMVNGGVKNKVNVGVKVKVIVRGQEQAYSGFKIYNSTTWHCNFPHNTSCSLQILYSAKLTFPQLAQLVANCAFTLKQLETPAIAFTPHNISHCVS